MAQPRAVQATPSGYLVDFGDGNEPRLVPENIAVEHGLVQPTPGMYQPPQGLNLAPDPYAPVASPAEQAGAMPQQSQQPPAPAPAPAVAAPAEAAPPVASPAPAPAPPNVSVGMSASDSGQTLVRRTDVRGAPAALDLSQERTDLAAAQAESTAGYNDARAALKQRADAVAGEGEVTADYARQGADLNRDFIALQTRADEAVNAHVEKKTAELNARIASVPQEDPGKIWTDNSAFQNAAGLLSAMLGGMLAVSTGSGRNMGLEAIERAIDRNINAQRTNIENEWKRIAHDKDSLQAYKDWKAQSREWGNQQRALMLETLALEREAEAQKFVSQSKQAELMGQAAELRVRSAEAQQEYIKGIASMAKMTADSELERWYKTEQLSLDKLNSASTRALQAAQRGQIAAEQAAKGPAGPAPIFRLPNGKQYYLDPKFTVGRTPAQVGKLADKLGEEGAKYAKVLDALQTHRQLVANVGSRYAGPGSANLRWSAEDMKTVRDSLERTSAVVAHSLSGSQYAEAFREAVKGFVGGSAGWTGASPVQSQTQYIDSEMAKMERDLAGRGAVAYDNVVAGEGGVPTIAGPTESGAPVLPKGHVLGQTPVPIDVRKDFYRGDIVQPDEKDLQKATRDLGRTVLTGKDPSSTLQALRQLSNTADAPLAVAPALLDEVFGSVEVKDVGGRTAVRYTGEGKDRKAAPVQSRADGIRLMRVNAMRMATKAEESGDPALASEILEAADQLAQRLNGTYKQPEAAPTALQQAYGPVPR